MSLSSTEIGIGIAALVIGGASVYIFMRATSNSASAEETQEEKTPELTEHKVSSIIAPVFEKGSVKLPEIKRKINVREAEDARSKIRTLSLQKEIISLVLKRLFEAEDEGEINKEERLDLSKGYESELRNISEELKQAELVVTLNELELIRSDILKKFEATLNTTQSRIDMVLKELKLDIIEEKTPETVEKKPKVSTKSVVVDEPEAEEENELEVEEETKPKKKPGSDVEAKLEQLRMEVLKELEELEKLELEA